MNESPANPAVPLETLLSHADWVRALARRLVADPASADDVEQEVWRAALEHPPREHTNPRGWLASVARNAARSLGRQRTRRTARERRVARAEALPATSELVAETELSRELAGEVLALEEPYRTVLLLRYWRAMDVDAIARAQSLPRETVRTQQKRGLERLRERLDWRFGARETWIAALAPLARQPLLSAAATASAGVLGIALKFGGAAALVALAWWVWPARPQPGGELAHSAVVSERPAARLESSEAAPASRTAAAGTPEHGEAARLAGAAAHASATRGLAGRAIGLDGQPLAGQELEWKRSAVQRGPHWEGKTLVLRHTSVDLPTDILELLRAHPEEIDKLIAEVGDEPGFREALLGTPPQRFLARTQADGRFEIELEQDSWTIVPTSERLALVAQVAEEGAPDWALILAPCVKLAGVVVDESGTGVAAARFSTLVALDRVDGLPRTQAISNTMVTLEGTDERGRFELPRVPYGPGMRLDVQAQGFLSRDLGSFEHDELGLRIELARPPKVERPELGGLVLDEHGAPVAGAWVALGQDSGASGADGRFSFTLSVAHPDEPLTATKPGFQAAVLESFGTKTMQPRSDILLRLGPPALSIRGRVRLPDGSSPGKCRVQIVDGTQLGSSDCSIEDASAGLHRPGVDSDEQGSFVLAGLRARRYRLLAWSGKRGQIALSEPIEAGSTEVVLQNRPSAFVAMLAGRVVTRHGIALADADVCLSMPTFVGRGISMATSYGQTRTDALGRFVLHDVPREWCRIGVSGASLRSQDFALPAQADTEIELVAELEVRTRIEIADERVDRLVFLDARGATVNGWVEMPFGLSAMDELRRVEGRFPTVRLTDAVQTAILSQGTTEIRRVPLEVRREEPLVLRF